MNPLLLSFGLFAPTLLPSLTAVPARPEAAPVSSPAAASAPDDKPLFGEPLTIDGKRITDRDIKLFLIYGPCSHMLELAKFNLVIEDQISRTAVENAEAAIKKPATDAAEGEVKKREGPARATADAEVEAREAPAREAAEATVKKQEETTPFPTPADRQKALDEEVKKELAKLWANPDDKQAIYNKELAKVWANPGDRQKVYDEVFKREYDKLFPSPDAQKKAYETELAKQKSLLHEKYTVTDEEVQKEFDSTITEFKQRYPVLDVPAEISRAFRTVDWYRKELRTMMQFDRVFLPPNPEEWPVVTREAVRADSGDILIEDAKSSYEMRKKAVEKTGGPLPKEDVIYVNMMRQIVRDAIFALVDFKTAGDGIAADIALWADVNGDGKPDLTITVDDMWSKVSDTVSQTEIDEAKQWFVTYNATLDRLKEDGHVLSSEDCSKAIGTLMKQYETSVNPGEQLTQLATRSYFFPSVDAYKQYYCLFEGFKQLVAPKLQPGPANDLPQALRDHFDHANRIMGLGQVEVEVMLVSAFDTAHFAWKKDGWSWAKKTADEIKAKIDANTKEFNEQQAKKNEAKAKGEEYKPEKEAIEPYHFWTQMMDDHSEYWDPPAPEGPGAKGSDISMKRKGRFGPRYRNDLITFVGETYYTQWVTGTSITDYVFFDQTEGSVAGPFKGPMGYYLTRVMRRSPPTRPLNLSEPKHVDLLREDFLRAAFIQYSKEAVAKAQVTGL
jgi:hypothetical protein